MPESSSTANIGRKMAKKLESVGIDSSEKLILTGSKQAFLKLKEFRGCRNGNNLQR